MEARWFINVEWTGWTAAQILGVGHYDVGYGDGFEE